LKFNQAFSFCAQTSELGAHFCTHDAQTFGVVKSSNFESGGGGIEMALKKMHIN